MANEPVKVRNRVLLRQRQVVQDIKEYILRNKLHPGDPLPTETELCDAVGASRSSVREAVKTLSALDIVDVRHGHGTYVGRLSLQALVESLAFRGQLRETDDFKMLTELVDVRQMLESGLAGQIIEAIDDRMHAELDELVAQMHRNAERGESMVAADRAFHLRLIEPVGNELVAQLTGAFWDVHAIVAPSLYSSDADAATTAAGHGAIVAAAAAGDRPGLVRAIEDHYRPVRARINDAGRSDPGSASRSA